MKKSIILFTLVCSLVWGTWAKPVDVNNARKVGVAYLTAMGHHAVGTYELVRTQFTGFYVFNAPDGGFVLVAADDCVRPILGYSLTGTFRADAMPTNVRGWLEDYEAGIEAVKESMSQPKSQGVKEQNSQRAEAAVAEEWQQLLGGVAPEPPLTTAVSPLLTTTWNQSPLYNDQCPYDNTYGQRVVTGCVATATAQIMKYWNHPATGYGSHSYQASNSHEDYGWLSANFGSTSYAWNQMPNALTSVSSTAEINAVAQLMYHVGVAIEMQYNVGSEGGSSAYNHSDYYPSAMSALVDYFKYSPDMVVLYSSGYDATTYCALLRAELDQNRPILYDGRNNSGGHSFVCDGYDNNNMFHFNWGWGGSYDGYFIIGSLNPSGYTYNMANTAIVGIRPNTSFGSGGTVTVNTIGGTAGCTVTGGGTYAFGDTVTLSATAATGYRFAGWSDNSQANPRTFIMTGGNYTFTAQFETIGSDTMSYCGNMVQQTYWGEYAEGYDKYWGIKLPASSLTVGQTLTAVDFYVGSYYNEGQFDMTVYSGTATPTDTVYSTTVWVNNNDREDWYAIYLPSAYTVEAGKSIWITFHNSDITFPATITASCGNPDGFLYGSAFNPDPEWNTFTFMIRGHFTNPGVLTHGDTMSYCGNKAYYTSYSVGEWGIMIPATELAGRNYLRSVKVFADYGGLYTLRVYRGGTDAPDTMVHTQPAEIDYYGWHEIEIDNTVSLNTTDNLWITFSCPEVVWPAASCRYTGNPNSNWMTWGDGTWWHLNQYYNSADYSWMIKAVTSATSPTLPAPTVIIRGEQYVGLGNTATFTAAHSTGTTVTWDLQGGTPATATGDNAATSWNSTGWYQITATVSNSHGTGSDQLWVNVVDCSQAITEYPYHLGFETYDNMVCVSTIDADNDGLGWQPYTYNWFYGQRSYRSPSSEWTESGQQALAVDDWLILPKMTTHQGAGYSMRWYDMPDWTSTGIHAHYGVYIDTTAGTNTSNYTLVAEYTLEDNWWMERTLDLSAYAGKTFRLAIRHHNNGGMSDLYLDDITVSEEMSFFREGDTISYCGWRNAQSNLGYNSGNTYWGVKFPATRLAGCDTLKSVLLYVVYDGDYTLNVWQGGDNAPATLQRNMTTNFTGQYGWQEFTLTPAMPIDGTQPMWITFYSTAYYPAIYAQYCGDPNSDWISGNGTDWHHCSEYDFSSSWMIKAVTSATEGCGGITLPYAADFTQCWSATGGASIIDNDHAAITAQGQRLVGPWMESVAGNTIFTWRSSCDDNYWGGDYYYTVTVEDETGVVLYTESYQSYNTWWEPSFTSHGGRIRVVFERTGPVDYPSFQISEVAVFQNIDLTIEAPGIARVGDTVTIAAHAIVADGGTVDSWTWYMYHYGYWIDENDASLTVIAQTDSSRTVVFHDMGNFQFIAQIYKDNLFDNHSVWLDRSLTINVYDSTTVDCNNISLPYTADFMQCWTAENGATIIDPSHASITSAGQQIVGPWMQSVPGKTFMYLSMQRDGNVDYNTERYIVNIENEDGVFLGWWNYAGNWSNLRNFTSPGGRIRVSIEYAGINSVPSLQINELVFYSYEIENMLDAPGIALVGDTVTITAHATLQNGDTPDYYDWYMYDPNGNWMNENNPARTILSRTDSTLVVVWNAPGRYQIYNNVNKYSVYQDYTAYAEAYQYINILDRPYHEEDSIYYTSAAKDTVISCHPQLHNAVLPASVRVIIDSAFFNLPNLSNVDMPDGLTHIGKMAFAWNQNITEITLPRGLKYVRDNAFWGCTNLSTVNFNADSCIEMCTGWHGGDFYPVFIGCNISAVNIGENVRRIPDFCFSNCPGLRGRIVIPDGVTYIGKRAFWHWVNPWTEGDTIQVVLGRNLMEIGDTCFPYTYGNGNSYNLKLTSVISHNPEPPIIHPATFYLNPDIVTLTVPCGTTEAYRGAYYWYEFTNIIEDCNAIEDMEQAALPTVYAIDGRIVVDWNVGSMPAMPVTVFDVMGRMVASTVIEGNSTCVSVPHSGVYMVRIGDHPARKVVVIR